MARSVTFNLELQITVSIGQPQVQYIQNPNIRQCADCARNYEETRNVWPQYPICLTCEEDRWLQQQYQRELEQNRLERQRAQQRIAAQRAQEQQDDSDWREDGF